MGLRDLELDSKPFRILAKLRDDDERFQSKRRKIQVFTQLVGRNGKPLPRSASSGANIPRFRAVSLPFSLSDNQPTPNVALSCSESWP